MTEYGNGNITALFGGTPFDPNAYEPSRDYEVLPPGKYTCIIESAELKDTQAGNGKFIKITLRVLEGQTGQNRKLFDNINILNPSEACQQMGIAQLSSLACAAECFPVGDTADLIDKVVIAVVKVKKRRDTGEDQNDIRTYEHPSVATNAQHVPAPAPVPAPQTALNAGLPVSPNPVRPSYVPPQAAPVATAPAPQPASVPPSPPAVAASETTAAGAQRNAPWNQ